MRSIKKINSFKKKTHKIKSFEDNNELGRLRNIYSNYNKQQLINEAINLSLFDDKVEDKNMKEKILNDLLDDTSTLSEDEKSSYNYYPDLTDPSFNYKIMQKKEFIDYYEKKNTKPYLSIVEEKCPNKPGKEFVLSNTQKFLKNFISPETPYNGLLLIHGTGVGKTCSAISIAEQFIPYALKNGQRIMILASLSVAKHFKREIFDIKKFLREKKIDKLYSYTGCTGKTYLNLLENIYEDKYLQDEEVFIKEMKKLISSRYVDIMGYDMFANMVKKIEDRSTTNIPIEDIEEIEFAKKKSREKYFSNTVLIIDEVHNVNVKTHKEEGGQKKVPPILKNVIEDSKNLKLILLSATPMFDTAIEIIYLLNLLLLNDKRKKITNEEFFDKYNNLKPDGAEKLQNISRGYISYVRGENPYSFPFRLTPDINNDKSIINFEVNPKYDIQGNIIPNEERIKYLKIIGDEMSDFQYEYYLSSELEKNDITDFENNVEYNASRFNSSRQLSNICFPSGYYGKDGLKNCFEINKANGSYKYKSDIIKKHGLFLKKDLIGRYSCKFKSILNYVLNSSGPVFIYSEWLSSGVIPLALVLEQNGFKKYGDYHLLDTERDNISYEGRYESNYKNKNEFSQAYYNIFSGDELLSGDKDNTIRIFNDIKNKDGKLLKVILVSQAGSEGIDLHGIREVHICNPWWNLNRIEQTIGRSIRNCSHKNLDIAERNVTIYLHSAICPKSELEKETIDLYMYRIALNKQLKISEVEYLLKKSSIDCYLNKNINMFPIKELNETLPIITSQKSHIKYKVGDRPFSSICNYKDSCEYNCESKFKIEKDDINKDTFVKYFAQDDIKYIKNEIRKIFLKKSIFTLKQIIVILNKDPKIKSIDNIYIYLALGDLIAKKEIFNGTFNRKGHIVYKNSYYLFNPENQLPSDLSLFNNVTPLIYKSTIKNLNTSLLNLKKSQKIKNQNYKKICNIISNFVEKILLLIKNKKLFLEDKFWLDKKDPIKKIIYEIAVDSLKNEDKEVVLQQILIDHRLNNSNIDPIVYNAFKLYLIDIRNNLYYITIKDKVLKYFWLHPKYPNLSIEDETFIEPTSDLINVLSKKINNNQNMASIYGFIYNSNFKIVINIGLDKTSSGVVCGNVDKPMIINTINELLGYQKYDYDGRIIKSKEIKKSIKIQKESLCYELQLLLRYKELYNNNNKVFFIRDYNLINSNN